MTTRETHVAAELGEYIEGALSAADAERVRAHLGSCLACRRSHDELRSAFDEIRALQSFEVPQGVWAGVERELDGGTRRSWMRAAAVAAVLMGGVLAASAALGTYRSSWSIERVAGAPVVGTRTVTASDALREGEWLETDASSRARLSIGTLGSADVGPGSRVKLVQAGGAERALRVERGSIDARVWAPPRFFLVETIAATAIDLGCIYTLDVDESGNGRLAVRSGQVELRGYGLSSLVVAGTLAEMRANAGPGTPYDSTESDDFRATLAAVDFGADTGRRAALERLLAQASPRSTITLWHLLPRVPDAARGLVIDRLAMLAPMPDGVDRDRVLALDRGALVRWRRALEPGWSTERVRLWKRAWRAIWSAARDS